MVFCIKRQLATTSDTLPPSMTFTILCDRDRPSAWRKTRVVIRELFCQGCFYKQPLKLEFYPHEDDLSRCCF